MSRYWRIYKNFVRFSMMQAMQFRFDFTFRILMDTMFYATNFYFYKVLFLHTNHISDWTEPQVMLFMSGYLLMDAIQMTVCATGTWMIPQYVNKGELDYYLLRPISSFFFLCFRDFSFSSAVNLVMALGIVFWAFHAYPDPIAWYRILIYGCLIITGCYLFLLARILMVLPVFWSHSGRGFESLFWTLNRFMERPDAIYTGWIRRLLLFVLPFITMCSLPARILFQEDIWKTAGFCILITVIFHFFIKFMWSLALRSYSSASS